MRKNRWLAIALLGLLAGGLARADDIRPEARTLADAQPMADEKCIEQCDIQSDKCMQDAASDAELQACDDIYSKCLNACEGR